MEVLGVFFGLLDRCCVVAYRAYLAADREDVGEFRSQILTSLHLDKLVGSLTSKPSIIGLITPTRPRSRLLQQSPNRVTSRRPSSAGDDASHCCVCRVLIACSAARRRLLPRYTSRPHPQSCRACSSAIIPFTTTYKATHRHRRLHNLFCANGLSHTRPA